MRVVEFCQVAAGPFCGMLLADLGAEVVKVEPPEGDMLRQWPPITEGFSENFASLNRNKRSVALDLKSAAGKDAARTLILAADVVVENNRPGVMDRLRIASGGRITEDDRLVIESDEHRSQRRNRDECIAKLRELIVRARVVPKRRKKTKPGRAAKERRITAKKQRGEIKSRRSQRFD